MTKTDRREIEALADRLVQAANWGGHGLKGETGDFGKLDEAAATLRALLAEIDALTAPLTGQAVLAILDEEALKRRAQAEIDAAYTRGVEDAARVAEEKADQWSYSGGQAATEAADEIAEAIRALVTQSGQSDPT